MRRRLSYLIAAGCMFGVTGIDLATAEACSFAPAEWVPLIRDNKLNATADGPLVIAMEGYTNPFDDLPALADSGYTVAVADVEGVEVSGELSTIGGEQPGIGRLVFTPDAPFIEGANYTVTIDGDAEFAGTQEVPLSIGTFSPDPAATLQAQERRTFIGPQECCQAASPEDYSCVQDSCGDYEDGAECRVCWPTELAFPVRVTFSDIIPDAGPWRDYYTVEIYDVTGTEEVVASGEALRGQVHFELPAIPSEDRCYEVVLQPVVDAGLDAVRSDSNCLAPDEIEVADHSPLDNAEDIDRCEPGTFIELDQDDNETPIDDPTEMVVPGEGGNNDDGGNGGGNNQTGGDGGEKGEPGGCQTTNATPSGGLLALLIGFFALRRRR